MGDRATRAPQSGDLTRAKTLRRALKRGASPDFIPPAVPNPPARPSALSWYSGETHSGEATPGEKYPGETPRPETSAENSAQPQSTEEILDLRRQYLEQLFESSPDALVILDASFRAQCVNREFQRMFGYSASQAMGQPIDSLIVPPDHTAESASWLLLFGSMLATIQ